MIHISYVKKIQQPNLRKILKGIGTIKGEYKFTYVQGTSEKLRRILRSHKKRSTFYTENTFM